MCFFLLVYEYGTCRRVGRVVRALPFVGRVRTVRCPVAAGVRVDASVLVGTPPLVPHAIYLNI